jgi:uncharacterized protein YeaO (DUF488 family)
MAAVENQPVYRGWKYTTPEEARNVHNNRMKEWKINKKDQYNEYQRKYQRKLREKRQILEQQNAQLQQQLIMYQQQSQRSEQQNIIVTPTLILEIIN